MWSHAITDASVGAGESTAIQNMSCRACDRSNTQFDVRHTLTMSSSYQLPIGPGHHLLGENNVAGRIFGGWKLSGFATARTGLPVNITVSRKPGDLPDGNASAQRPDLVPGVSIYAANQTTFSPRTVLTAFTSLVELKSNTPNTKGPTRDQVAKFGDNYLMSNDPTRPDYY